MQPAISCHTLVSRQATELLRWRNALSNRLATVPEGFSQCFMTKRNDKAYWMGSASCRWVKAVLKRRFHEHTVTSCCGGRERETVRCSDPHVPPPPTGGISTSERESRKKKKGVRRTAKKKSSKGAPPCWKKGCLLGARQSKDIV